MKEKNYEFHRYENDNIPIIYHKRSIRGKWDYYMHWHENIEILFINNGRMEIRLDDATFYAGENEAIVVNSSVMHDLAAADGGSVEYDCLIIDKAFCEKHGFFIDEVYIEEVIGDYELIDVNCKIRYLLTDKPPYYEAEALSCLLKILVLLFRSHKKEGAALGDGKNLNMVKEGIKYIGKHFKEDLNVEVIANAVGYSKYYFSRTFKEITGYAVSEYINRVRVNYAIKRLREDGVNVGQLSVECGFADVSYFTKIFKKYIGVLPSKVEKRKLIGKNVH